MTPESKALELGNKMYNGSVFNKTKKEHLDELQNAKRCALIAVDEIIQTYHSPMDDEQIQEWQEVRKEVEKLPA